MSDTAFRVLIPARHASTRFPGKPLARLAGRPVLQHVYENGQASGAETVIIATDDARIRAAALAFGAEVVMTSAAHRSGTDRIAEVVAAANWPADSIVVNLQGDAPLLPPADIEQVAALLAGYPAAAMATLCTPLAEQRAYHDPNVVKVVMDRAGRALYFSRSPIPALGHDSDPARLQAYRHLGLYAYRAAALLELSRTAPCYLEELERLEQLRALWLGMEIRVGIAKEPPGPDVDTLEDLAAAERAFAAR